MRKMPTQPRRCRRVFFVLKHRRFAPMSRIDAPLQPPSQFDPGRGAGASADGRTGMQGRMDNQRVVVDTGQSVLTDAAEEISLHHAEKAEAKHSAERKKELTRLVSCPADT
jgi:type III secretion protein W